MFRDDLQDGLMLNSYEVFFLPGTFLLVLKTSSETSGFAVSQKFVLALIYNAILFQVSSIQIYNLVLDSTKPLVSTIFNGMGMSLLTTYNAKKHYIGSLKNRKGQEKGE